MAPGFFHFAKPNVYSHILVTRNLSNKWPSVAYLQCASQLKPLLVVLTLACFVKVTSLLRVLDYWPVFNRWLVMNCSVLQLRLSPCFSVLIKV